LTSNPRFRPDDLWYFAYGSNLDAEQKEFRTGPIREGRKCRLLDHRFAFNKRAAEGLVYANVMPQAGGVVWGVVYRCSPAALNLMDDYEGVRGGHYVRTSVTVVTDASERLDAVTYVAGQDFVCAEGIPDRGYLDRILRGAEGWGLPAEYLRSVKALGTSMLLATK